MHRNRQKKGISTIIAAVFMVAIIIVGLNVMIWGSNLQSNLGQVITERNVAETEQSSEKIELRDVKINGNKFNMTVVNTGALPVKLVSMWVTNTTATNGWHQNYTLVNKLINPGDSLVNLGQDLSLVAKNSSSYKINVVTERGSLANFQIFSPADKAIKMSLFAVPRSIPFGQNVTIMFGVTNNLTDGSILQSIRPKLPLNWTRTESVNGTTTATATLIANPTPAVEESLTLAETTFFKWVYKVTGDKGDKIKFNATVVDARQGNYITEEVEVVVDAFAEQSNVAIQSLGLSTGTPGTTEKLQFHQESVPNLPSPARKRMDSVLVHNNQGNRLFDTGTDIERWITNNSTELITIAAGNWNYTVWGDCDENCPSTIKLKLEKTDQNGNNPVVLPNAGLIQITATSTTQQSWTSPNFNPVIVLLLPGERLQVTMERVSGEFRVYWDDTGKESYLKTPTQTPKIPSFNIYTGGDVLVSISNTGTKTMWIDMNGRVIFKKSGTGTLYGGAINGWTNQTQGASPSSGLIEEQRDSAAIPPGKQLLLEFNEPRKVPSTSTINNPSVTSNLGNYDVYVRLMGYDETGGFVLRVVIVGIIVV